MCVGGIWIRIVSQNIETPESRMFPYDTHTSYSTNLGVHTPPNADCGILGSWAKPSIVYPDAQLRVAADTAGEFCFIHTESTTCLGEKVEVPGDRTKNSTLQHSTPHDFTELHQGLSSKQIPEHLIEVQDHEGHPSVPPAGTEHEDPYLGILP